MNTAFETWLAKEFEHGLVDIKFAVVPGKGVSVEAVQNEVLAAEAAIQAGYFKAAPAATSMLPAEISAFVALH